MDCTEVMWAEKGYIGLSTVMAAMHREKLASPGTTGHLDNELRILQRAAVALVRRYGDISVTIGGKDAEEKKKKTGHGPPGLL